MSIGGVLRFERKDLNAAPKNAIRMKNEVVLILLVEVH